MDKKRLEFLMNTLGINRGYIDKAMDVWGSIDFDYDGIGDFYGDLSECFEHGSTLNVSELFRCTINELCRYKLKTALYNKRIQEHEYVVEIEDEFWEYTNTGDVYGFENNKAGLLPTDTIDEMIEKLIYWANNINSID